MKFNHKIITAGYIYCLRRLRFYLSISRTRKRIIANALIVEVIFQLNSIVYINLRLKRHDAIQNPKTYHVEGRGRNFTI